MNAQVIDILGGVCYVTDKHQTERLFIPEGEPCTSCDGTGLADSTNPLRPCLGCGGTGMKADQPDPSRDPLPEGY